MPLYLYKCPNGHEFEQRQPLDYRSTAICPVCGEVASKQLTPANFTFGWTRSILVDPEARKDELVRDI